ncbi:MAG: glycosyltransferase family 4 protein [Candidatus Hodarchaeota archaeon]
MRICYVSGNTGPHSERFLRKMEVRHEVHVVSMHKVPTEYRDRHPRVKFHFLDLSFSGFNIGGFKNLIKGYFFLRRVIQKIKPDILWGGYIQKDGMICALTNYHPFLLMPWGSDILIDAFRNLFLRKGSSWIISRADKISCDAYFVRDRILELSNRNKDDIIVFPWGVEREFFNPSVDGSKLRAELGWEDNLILIMSRRFEPVYNVSTFLHSLPPLCKEFPELRVILCGDGPLKDGFLQFVSSHGLEEKVLFAGLVPQEKIPIYYAAADIYVSSSLSDGSSLCLLEAMAIGLPVVVSEIPSIMEWVTHGQNGFIFPSRDVKALLSCLRELIKNQNLRDQFSHRNQLIAQEQADWNHNYEKLETIFQELQNHPRKSGQASPRV